MRQAKAWIYALILVVIIIGLVVFFWWWQNSKTETTPISKTTTAAAKEEWVKNKTVLFDNTTSSNTIKLDDGTFRMYLQNYGKIMYLGSQDATNFGEPISTGIVEASDKMISNPAILKIAENNWIMIYEEQPMRESGQKEGPSGPESQRNLLLATSEDGKNFTAAGVAIDSSKEDNYFASVPDLVMTPEGKVRMYYVCGGEEICSAISDDGKSWTKEAGVRMSDKAVDPDVMRNLECLSCNEPIKWVMYFATLEGGGNKFYKSTSDDGLQWTKGEIVLRPDADQGSIVDPDLIEITPGKWRMFFGEMAEAEPQMEGPGQINLYWADFEGDIFI